MSECLNISPEQIVFNIGSDEYTIVFDTQTISVEIVNELIEVNLCESAPIELDLVEEVISVEFSGVLPGPQGLPGPPGGQVIEYEAGQDLSSGRAVVIDGGAAFYFQPGTPMHAGRVAGVTKTAALTGSAVQVQLSGEFTDAGLGLTVDRPVFAGANGVLSVTPSPTGIVQMMGVAVAADEMIIQIQLPLIHN